MFSCYCSHLWTARRRLRCVVGKFLCSGELARWLGEEMTGGGWADLLEPWRGGILSGKPPELPARTPWPGCVESAGSGHCGCRLGPGGTAASLSVSPQSSLSDGHLGTGQRWLHLSTSSCTSQPQLRPGRADTTTTTTTSTSSAQQTGHHNTDKPGAVFVCLFVCLQYNSYVGDTAGRLTLSVGLLKSVFLPHWLRWVTYEAKRTFAEFLCHNELSNVSQQSSMGIQRQIWIIVEARYENNHKKWASTGQMIFAWPTRF